MKRLAIYATCVISFSLVSCSETYEDIVSNTDDLPSVYENKSDSVFVTAEEALAKANSFLGKNSKINESKSPNVEPVKENGKTIFYVINYPEGGFVAVSATKDYYPVLAYSEENNMDLSVDNEGLKEWIEETKVSVRDSHAKNDSIKVEMHSLWIDKGELKKTFIRPTATTRGYSYSSGQIACWNRLDEYAMKYGDGWYFAPLSDPSVREAFERAGYAFEYENLLYSANFNHSSPECSVVGWKNDQIRKKVEPMLETKWHQKSPFNNLCDGYPAGCAAIAVAQVMKYYEHPNSFSYNGYKFNWTTIPKNVSKDSDQDVFVKLVSNYIGTHYSFGAAWTTPGSVKDGLEDLGYSVSLKDHRVGDVTSSLLCHKPVIMLGNDTDLEVLPGNLQYLGNSHYWVADGVETVHNYFHYFTEWQPYDRGNFIQGWGSFSNPNTLSVGGVAFYHMNWGHNGTNDGWFTADSARENDKYNYKYSRQNFYISKK